MHFIAVLCLFCLASFSWGLPRIQQDECEKGEDYWCRDKETAMQCGVLAFCSLKGHFVSLEEDVTTDVKPIQIDLYYEAFCGGCQKFIREQLYPAYQKLYNKGVFEISLFPYGNAHEKQVGDKWQFECQHGEEECRMNLLETCAVHLLSHPHQFMPYIHCVESNPSLGNAEKCAKDLQIEWDPIAACYNGSEGNYLEHQMAQKTDALVPRHTYVPWIVVDGHHDERMQTDAQVALMEFLCDHYKGPKPAECKQIEKSENRCYK